jgi:nucleoporin POM152
VKAPADASSTTIGGSNRSGPLIPLALLDAPTQRGYVAALYVILWAWRLVDYSLLVSNDIDSPWQWMKWTVMDGIFLFGVPELRIPWLEWSSTTIAFIFLFHAILNGILMFRIPV